jgi:hypothetical protein
MEDVGIFSTILSILRLNGILCGYLVHLVVIWYIFPVLVYCTEKNLATLPQSRCRLFSPLECLSFFI